MIRVCVSLPVLLSWSPAWGNTTMSNIVVVPQAALYTNVDTRRAVEACLQLLRLHHQNLQLFGLSGEDVEELLRSVVEVSTFRFRNVFYKQTRGLAMGSRLAPLLAIIFMDCLERPALSTRVLYFGRYIDDIFAVGKSSTTLRQTLGRLNSAFPTIKLTSEAPGPDGFLPFLNMKVRIYIRGSSK